jgi:hypothetical protein
VPAGVSVPVELAELELAEPELAFEQLAVSV